jgi:Flp pilus assembly protein TadD
MSSTPDLQGIIPTEARLSQARKLYTLGRWQEALVLLEPLVLEHPGYADLHNMVGVSNHHMGQWTRAERAFSEALQLNPRYTEAALNLAVLLNDTGRYEQARVIYKQALEVLSHEKNAMDPLAAGKIANMHSDIAAAYVAAHRPEEAQAEYERALALCPTFADIRHSLAGLLIEMKQLDAAIAQLQRCIADSPKYLQPRLRLGALLLTMNRVAEAQVVYEAVLAISPEQPDALRGLRLVQDPTRSPQVGMP